MSGEKSVIVITIEFMITIRDGLLIEKILASGILQAQIS
jgi:hypothetical protein